jgi:hypothetical protein
MVCIVFLNRVLVRKYEMTKLEFLNSDHKHRNHKFNKKNFTTSSILIQKYSNMQRFNEF